MLQNKAYTPEKAKALRLTAESRNMITDFSAAMDEQLIFITNYITEVSDEDLASEVDLFGTWHAMPIRSYFINILFKNYAAYRMQLFLYMKNGLGMTELNTKNLWMGHDGSM